MDVESEQIVDGYSWLDPEAGGRFESVVILVAVPQSQRLDKLSHGQTQHKGLLKTFHAIVFKDEHVDVEGVA